MFPSEYYMYRSFRDNKMSKPGIMSMPLFGIRGEVRALPLWFFRSFNRVDLSDFIEVVVLTLGLAVRVYFWVRRMESARRDIV